MVRSIAGSLLVALPFLIGAVMVAVRRRPSRSPLLIAAGALVVGLVMLAAGVFVVVGYSVALGEPLLVGAPILGVGLLVIAFLLRRTGSQTWPVPVVGLTAVAVTAGTVVWAMTAGTRYEERLAAFDPPWSRATPPQAWDFLTLEAANDHRGAWIAPQTDCGEVKAAVEAWWSGDLSREETSTCLYSGSRGADHVAFERFTSGRVVVVVYSVRNPF